VKSIVRFLNISKTLNKRFGYHFLSCLDYFLQYDILSKIKNIDHQLSPEKYIFDKKWLTVNTQISLNDKKIVNMKKCIFVGCKKKYSEYSYPFSWYCSICCTNTFFISFVISNSFIIILILI
jgi:hypothetical protein